MVAINRKYTCNNEYLILGIHDGNEISTANPTFSGSSNTVELVLILSIVGVTVESKMVATNRKYKH